MWTLPDGGNILENGDTLKANFEHEGIYRIIVSYEIPLRIQIRYNALMLGDVIVLQISDGFKLIL
ncbi:MAG: hypothetical protein IPI90_08105 [Saprospiraceae bacterium]|nr:hypothetical protein [Candidatus Vicinibacter affinis]